MTTSPVCSPASAAGLFFSTAATLTPGCEGEGEASAAGTTPCQVLLATAEPSSVAATFITLSTGMAKPMPWAPARTATLMPIISPSMFNSGPPELPGLMLASVWIRSS